MIKKPADLDLHCFQKGVTVDFFKDAHSVLITLNKVRHL